MRVLLSGTSNSIIAHGFSHGIERHSATSSFRNVSFGASSTIALGDHLRGIDFTQHDVCIFEYCVNEEVYIFLRQTTVDEAMSNIAAACDAASRAGCLPVIAVFANENRMALNRPLEAALINRFGALGVPVFNIHPLLKNLVQSLGRPSGDFFQDPNHVSREIGASFGAGIMDALQAGAGSPRRLIETDQSYRQLRFVPYSQMQVSGHATPVSRQTRLAAADLLQMQPSAQVTCFSSAAGIECAGITFNAARSWGHLDDLLTGVRVLSSEWKVLFSTKRELTLICVPVLSVLEVPVEGLSLVFVPEDITGPNVPPIAFETTGFVLREQQAGQKLALLVAPDAPPAPPEVLGDKRYEELLETLVKTFDPPDTSPATPLPSASTASSAGSPQPP